MTTGVEQEGTRELADVLETVEARTLLEAAQATGSITTDDIALALDELDLDAAQIDDVYRAFEELQIEVVGVGGARVAAGVCDLPPRAGSPSAARARARSSPPPPGSPARVSIRRSSWETHSAWTPCWIRIRPWPPARVGRATGSRCTTCATRP